MVDTTRREWTMQPVNLHDPVACAECGKEFRSGDATAYAGEKMFHLTCRPSRWEPMADKHAV